MKLLVDENLSVRIAARLEEAGHDAVHVTAVGLGSTDDAVILEAAAVENQIVLTADADFSTMLALRGRSHPSVLMLRWCRLVRRTTAAHRDRPGIRPT